MKPEAGGSLDIDQRIYAPAEEVAAFIGDFRNAKVDGRRRGRREARRGPLPPHARDPIGRLDTEANVVEHGPHTIRWVYDTTMVAGQVDVRRRLTAASSPTEGEFHMKRELLDRAARLAGVERFARKNGERSLARLKHLMEARRYR